jgi:hypothetical protein
MTTPTKLRANQGNARASTGPKSAAGKARSARNARRHGLAVSVWSDRAVAAEVEVLAHDIAGPGASPHCLELSRPIAEAQVDIIRIRRARHDLLERTLSDPDYFSPKFATRHVRDLILVQDLISKSLPIPRELRWVLKTPEGPEKFAQVLSDLTQRISAMDRYERRALSRRKFAIRAFDRARRFQTDTGQRRHILAGAQKSPGRLATAGGSVRPVTGLCSARSY